jgi:hypothetical protein
MKPDAVVDTDVCSFLFKRSALGAPYIGILEEFNPVISFMTQAELSRWALRHDWQLRRRFELEQFVESLAIYHSDRQLCQRWAEVTEVGRRSGRPINSADAWIAATALELDCPLITHNAQDYRVIAELQIRTAATL